MITRIVSGGQTGADRAALDFAIGHGIPHGGWVPKGRKTEDGTLPETYDLREMPTEELARRTEQNIIDSDGTLILSHGCLTGGSALTEDLAERLGKPRLHIDLNGIAVAEASATVAAWILRHRIRVLNVAGPRASKDPKIYPATLALLGAVLTPPSPLKHEPRQRTFSHPRKSLCRHRNRLSGSQARGSTARG